MTEYSRVPGVPNTETTEYSRVPGVPNADEMTEYILAGTCGKKNAEMPEYTREYTWSTKI